jgi:hypothetical protein
MGMLRGLIMPAVFSPFLKATFAQTQQRWGWFRHLFRWTAEILGAFSSLCALKALPQRSRGFFERRFWELQIGERIVGRRVFLVSPVFQSAR